MENDDKNKNGWSRYEYHVLQSLDKLDATMQRTLALMERDRKDITHVKAELITMKNDYRWYIRIAGAVWGFIVTGVNVLLIQLGFK